MVKGGSWSFLASSVAKGSIVLSKAIEKHFAFEAEISRLRHHVSVLSKRLHSVTVEKQVLEDIVKSTMSGEEKPLEDKEVAGEGTKNEAAPSVAEEDGTMYVAEEKEDKEEENATMSVAEVAREMWMIVASPVRAQEPEPCVAEPTSEVVPEMAKEYNRFAMHLVEEMELEDTPPPRSVLSRVAEVLGRCERLREVEERLSMEKERYVEEHRSHCLDAPEELKEIDRNSGNTVGEGRRLESSGDENMVIGGVIVAGCASTKRKNAARRKKRKLLREGEKEKAEYYKGWVPL